MWDFSKNIFKDDGLHQLILGVRDANASFTSLTVQNCTVRDHKIMKLVAAMLDKNSNIVKLDMSDCNIRDIGIAFLLKGLANHRSLRNVNLSGNQFGASQAAVDMFLWAKASNVIEEFRMARLQMPSKTVKAVVALLEKPNSSLRCLDISGNAFGAKAGLILQALADNIVMQEVHLGDLDITEKTSPFLHRFIKGTSKCLVHMDLRNTSIGKKLLPGILQCVALDKLRVLDLTGVLGMQGSANGVALANLVDRSSVLETLILCGVTFEREAWKAFLQGLASAKSLKRLELDGINVEKVPLAPLKAALSKCPAVRELSLRRCPGFGHEQLIDFLSVVAVGSDSGLRLLDVRANRDLVNLLKHKKYGEKYEQLLSGVYLELRCDSQEKKK